MYVCVFILMCPPSGRLGGFVAYCVFIPCECRCVLIPCECPPSVCIMNIWYIHTYTQEMSVGLVFRVLVSFASLKETEGAC